MNPVGRARQGYEIVPYSAAEPRSEGNISATAVANAAAQSSVARTDSEGSSQSQANQMVGGAHLQTQPRVESMTQYNDPKVALNMILGRSSPDIGADTSVLRAINARQQAKAALEPNAEKACELAEKSLQAASGQEANEECNGGPEKGKPQGMKRPTMKRPAATSNPCIFKLVAEQTRKTWRGKVGATSKSFKYGTGQQYPSANKAREAACAHLDAEIAKAGHRAKFPRDASHICLCLCSSSKLCPTAC